MEERVWVEDRKWIKLQSSKKCRCLLSNPRRYCKKKAYFAFPRSNGYWAYCKEHMYGRVVRDGKVLVAVHPESEAAKRGYTDL